MTALAMSTMDMSLLGVGVSADAFAVAICKGLCLSRFDRGYATKIAILFGFFQGMMTFLGYYIGYRFIELIMNIDHWMAFTLLFFIGGKMVYEAITEEKDEEYVCPLDMKFDIKEMLVLSVATSIDALAVGLSLLAFDVNILKPSGIIALTTFAFSFVAVYLGFKFGDKFKKSLEVLGGCILVFIGLKILLEHLLDHGFLSR